MKSRSTPKRSKVQRVRRRGRTHADEMNQATGDEFEREGMGIAPKE